MLSVNEQFKADGTLVSRQYRDETGNPVTDQVAATRSPNTDTVRQRLTAFLALPNPTAVQNAKAVKALIRFVLTQLDDVSDT
jgi:hypothetical protein